MSGGGAMWQSEHNDASLFVHPHYCSSGDRLPVHFCIHMKVISAPLIGDTSRL